MANARKLRAQKARKSAQAYKAKKDFEKDTFKDKRPDNYASYERKDKYSQAEQDAHRARTGSWKRVKPKKGESVKQTMLRSGRLTAPGDPEYGTRPGSRPKLTQKQQALWGDDPRNRFSS